MSTILLCQPSGSELADLQASLTRKGYHVALVSDIAELACLQDSDRPSAQHVDRGAIELVIADLSTSTNGLTHCEEWARACSEVPMILIIAENASVSEECKQLTCGNVLRLPFTSRKVIRRVDALLSRGQGEVIQVGQLKLIPETRCVYRGEEFYRLTPRQAKLLEIFMRNAGRTLTRKYLMEAVWDTDYMGDTRTLDVHVRWIRERIEEKPSSPKYLRTVRGIGYRFAAPATNGAAE